MPARGGDAVILRAGPPRVVESFARRVGLPEQSASVEGWTSS